MRHNRDHAFDTAWRARDDASRWTARATDPNDPAAIAHRAHTLAAAWRPEIADRIGFLRGRCHGKVVLDIGCVAHDVDRLDDGAWLHAHIADAADRCIGVDILEAGVDAVRAAGYDAVVHDLSTGLGPLEERAPFDVVVAGELVEHVADLDMLFEVAAAALAHDGELILTTPNPYAPARVRAGQRGIVWENVDHIAYVFPSGVAELAERRGLVLTEATTVADRDATDVTPVRWLKRTIKGSHWRNTGYDREGTQQPVNPRPVAAAWRRFRGPRERFLGETFIYVIRHATARA